MDMFDDDMDDDLEPIEELIMRYQNLKNGIYVESLEEEAFERVIEYYFNKNNDSEALNACDIGIQYYPLSTSILLIKAEILTQNQKYGQALKTLDVIDLYDKSNIYTVLLRSDILINQAKYDEAIVYLKVQSQNFDGNEKIEILLELVDICDENEAYSDIYSILKDIVCINHRNDEALQKITFWANFSNQVEDCIDLHLHITEVDPYNTLAWFNLGTLYQSLKLYEKAIDSYEYCIAIDDSFEFAYRNLADSLMHLKKYNAAIEALQKNLEIAKPEDVIFEAMAYCHEKQKDFGKARHFYRQASQLNPNDDTIFYKIGETYARENQWEKAIKSFTTAFSLNNQNATYSFALGKSLLEIGIINEAILCFQHAVGNRPSTKNNWIYLTKALYLAELHEEALSQLEIAEVYCGNKVDFKYLKAAILLQMGKSKEALIVLEDALTQNIKLIKVFTQLNPDNLKRKTVADLIARYKHKSK